MALSIIDAVNDPNLFKSWFSDPSWAAWKAFLAALFALPMPEHGLEAFRQATGRTVAPTVPAREGWLIVGRRGGKSLITALVAVYLAAFRDWTPFLSPGERGVVMVIANDRRQARVTMRYVKALLEIPMLCAIVERQREESVELSNRVAIEVHTASFRTIRGYTVVAALLDECAFWYDDGANPDHEIIQALRPAMATVEGSMLIALSSPYSRRGMLWEQYKRHHGQDGDVLVWRADTLTMNPTVRQSVIEQAYAEDPASAAAEYGAQFRSDLEAYVSREALDACVAPGRYELPRFPGTTYHAFVDPSGGSSDSMTLSICHAENDRVIVDALRERRPPFSPDAVVAEFCKTLKAYDIGEVSGDRYGGEWPRERFSVHGVSYRTAGEPKSALYLQLLPLLNGGRVELLDHPKSLAQLGALERRTARSGKDSVDHPPRSHDDLANVIAGAASMVYLGEAIGQDGFDISRSPVIAPDTPWGMPSSAPARWTPMYADLIIPSANCAPQDDEKWWAPQHTPPWEIGN